MRGEALVHARRRFFRRSIVVYILNDLDDGFGALARGGPRFAVTEVYPFGC